MYRKNRWMADCMDGSGGGGKMDGWMNRKKQMDI